MLSLKKFIYILFSLSCFTQLAIAQDIDKLEFKKFWKTYHDFLIKSDTNKLKTLAFPLIKCRLCVNNDLIENLQNNNPDTWYSVLYDSLNYILKDEFFKHNSWRITTSILLNKVK